MDEETPQQEPEKPRFLLPNGCKDLIDAFTQAEPDRKMMYCFDQAGNSLGPPQELHESEATPLGLSALHRFVSRLFTSATPFGSLVVSTANERHGFALARQDGRTLLLFSVPTHSESELEHSVRQFFAVHEITPTHDYLANDGDIRCIDYLLPQSPNAVTTVCRELLTNCFGARPDDTLRFLFDRVP